MARSRAISRVRRVYVRRRGGARRKSFTLPVAVVAGFAPMGVKLFGAVKRGLSGDVAGMTQEAVVATTGYNTDTKSFYWPAIPMFYGPILAGMVVHKIANRIGVNRALSRAGVPFIRI